MSYISGFTVQPVGCKHELERFATAKNLAAAEQLDSEISQHNRIVAELDQLVADVSNQVLQSDPISVKNRILTQPVTLGPAALALLERKANLLPILQAAFKPWQAERQKTLNAKWSDLETKLADIGANPRSFEARQLIALLCWDEAQDANWNPTIFVTLGDGYIGREKAGVEHAIRQSMKS
jgi:hypothetical protein